MLGGEKSRLHSKPSAQVIFFSMSWETDRTSALGFERMLKAASIEYSQ